MNYTITNVKKYLCFIVLSIFFKFSFGQSLILANLDLNEGGVIHDIAFDPYNELYIVVGDFSSINDHLAENVAFINAADFTVNTSDYFDLVSSVDGPVYSVEFASRLTEGLFGGHYYYYYFGGKFTNVNGHARNGLAKFQYFDLGSYAPVDSDITLNSFNPDFSYPLIAVDSYIVYDMEDRGDTLIVGGSFGYTNEGDADEVAGPLMGFRISSNLSLTGYPNLGLDYGDIVINLTQMGGSLFVSTLPEDFYLEDYDYTYYLGSGDLYKVDDAGTEDLSFNAGVGGCYDGHFQAVQVSGDRMVALSDPCGGAHLAYMDAYDLSTGEWESDHSFSFPEEFPAQSRYGLAAYKSQVISALKTTKTINAYTANDAGDDPSVYWSFPIDNGLVAEHMHMPVEKRHIFVENNIVFFSTDDLTAVDGNSKTGLALICLEPLDIEDFVLFDTTICQRDIVTYSVEQADYADGYIWEFTGEGADIGNTGAPENLSDTLYNEDADAWTREIRFTDDFAPGELRVTPFTTCNGNIGGSTLLTSNTISINIMTNPLPDAVAGEDTALTCSITEVILHGDSDTPDVTYEWNVSGGDIFGVHAHQDTLVGEPGIFVLSVINEIGCLNTDTVVVAIDTLKPTFDPVEGPFDLTCSDTVRTYVGFCNNLTDTTNFWIQLTTGDTLPNPVDVTLPGQYQFYTINNQNGCIDSLNMPILVYLNQPGPNIKITGYDDIPADVPLDTLNCYDPVLTLECNSDTAGTVLNWVEADSTDPAGAIIDVSESGNYYILARNTTNGCYNYVGLNIAADFSEPNVILPEVSALNCSNDSLILDGGTIFLDTILEWTAGDDPTTFSNPMTICEAGTYYLTVTKNDNGCSATDSLDIVANNSIDVSAGNDIIACDSYIVMPEAEYTGDIGEATFLWDNGTMDATAPYTAGTDTIAIVEIFGEDDCYGTDTVLITTPPVPEIEFETFQPCGEGATGSIVATPVSGFAPFEYAIDGVTFQTSPAISGLDFGTYTITVKDSLDCLYEYSETIDETSDLPTPEFMFSTYNFQMDTVIVINVSNPPADSVQWVFSEELEYVGDKDGSPLILLPDTGSFIITMDAWYGDCLVAVTKEIFVTEFDSTFATFDNQNGIESVELFPNPTNGSFTVTVSFYKKQRATMGVQDMIGYVYEQREFEEVENLSETFDLPFDAINGTYVLHLTSEFDSAYITFILSR